MVAASLSGMIMLGNFQLGSSNFQFPISRAMLIISSLNVIAGVALNMQFGRSGVASHPSQNWMSIDDAIDKQTSFFSAISSPSSSEASSGVGVQITMQPQEWEKVRGLGKGSYGEVIAAKPIPNGEPGVCSDPSVTYAVKIPRPGMMNMEKIGQDHMKTYQNFLDASKILREKNPKNPGDADILVDTCAPGKVVIADPEDPAGEKIPVPALAMTMADTDLQLLIRDSVQKAVEKATRRAKIRVWLSSEMKQYLVTIIQMMKTLYEAGFQFCDFKGEQILVFLDGLKKKLKFGDLDGLISKTQYCQVYSPLYMSMFMHKIQTIPNLEKPLAQKIPEANSGFSNLVSVFKWFLASFMRELNPSKKGFPISGSMYFAKTSDPSKVLRKKAVSGSNIREFPFSKWLPEELLQEMEDDPVFAEELTKESAWFFEYVRVFHQHGVRFHAWLDAEGKGARPLSDKDIEEQLWLFDLMLKSLK